MAHLRGLEGAGGGGGELVWKAITPLTHIFVAPAATAGGRRRRTLESKGLDSRWSSMWLDSGPGPGGGPGPGDAGFEAAEQPSAADAAAVAYDVRQQ
jgi:hypothetical protein